MSKLTTKKILGEIKLTIYAGKATPAPPIGPALAPKKVNIPTFCKQFNDLSLKEHEIGTPIPVVITVYQDNSFTFEMKTPPTSYLIFKSMDGNFKGLSNPGKVKGPEIMVSALRNIAKKKMKEMRVKSLEEALKCVVGTAKSSGLDVINDENL